MTNIAASIVSVPFLSLEKGWMSVRYLIGQRRENDRNPGKWEFPGGKIEKGETPRQTLRRELEEELDLLVILISPKVFFEIDYNYPDGGQTHVSFYEVKSFLGTPALKAHQAIEWVAPWNLTKYDFLPTNQPVAVLLAAKEEKCTLDRSR